MKPEKILIADDEIHMRRLLGYSLKKAGYAVIEAENGNRAFELVEKMRPDLIIADLMMPEKNGIDFCRKVRGALASAETPLIFISAGRQLSEKIIGFKAGADEFVNKPFELDEMLDIIGVLLKKRRIPEFKREEKWLPPLKTGTELNPGIREILEISLRYKRVFSLVLVKIGHRIRGGCSGKKEEEIVVTSIAKILSKNIRKADLLSVYTGDLFSVIMPETPREGAEIFVERVRSALSGLKLFFKGGPLQAEVLVSAGTASFPEDGSREKELLNLLKERLIEDSARNEADAAALSQA